MSEIITTLHPKGTPTDDLFPNIKSDNIPNGAITSAKIGSNAVTSAKITNSAISTSKINDGAVTNPKISNGAVDTDKIGDSAVTTIKINDNAVTSTKILDNAITTNKITDNAITLQKMGFHLYKNFASLYCTQGGVDYEIHFNFDATNFLVNTTNITDFCTFYNTYIGVSNLLVKIVDTTNNNEYMGFISTANSDNSFALIFNGSYIAITSAEFTKVDYCDHHQIF